MGVIANVRVGNNAVNLTPLDEAARLNNAAAMETMLKHGANPNARDPVGSLTPLHWAANFLADRKVFELLLAYKAERNARDVYGQTPLNILMEKAKADNLTADSAGKKKAGELADLLRQHGAVDNLPN
jgi:ankyrin repeat protein